MLDMNIFFENLHLNEEQKIEKILIINHFIPSLNWNVKDFDDFFNHFKNVFKFTKLNLSIPPELPDDMQLRHASKSLYYLCQYEYIPSEVELICIVFQYYLGSNVNFEWDNLCIWNKYFKLLNKILFISLPFYQKTFLPRFSYEIDSMICDMSQTS
jgi:hypothetical protein